ncbi:Dot/Icm type IV secretion system effector LegA2 [Legionella bozemanae]|uniref:ankyrin repeat domain-containing protein n=1 Tax=Legionella bozemanae TaxID=447 RepID=UPI00399CF104
MKRSVDQKQVIDKLNLYLKRHNMPVQMNNEGVCNGLATLYAKYVLEGKENQFFKILEEIVKKNPASAMESDINQFVYDVVLTLFPEQFDKELSQASSMRALTINNKPMKSSFDFAITTSDKNWEEIFKTLALQQNEVMRIGGTMHAVSVRRKDNKYVVYDPNYSSGTKEFASEREVIAELHNNVLRYQKGRPLGMTVSVIRHPENKEPRIFPKISELYDRYLTQKNIDDVAVSHFGGEFNTLRKAAEINDASVIQHLLELGAKDKDHQAARIAVVNNNPDALAALLGNNKDSATFATLFIDALAHGREKTYDQLFLLKKALPFNNPTQVIQAAAKGGNPNLLKKVMNYYGISGLGADELHKAIPHAIHSGSTACVRLLVERLVIKKQPLSVEKNMEYLLESIKQNQPYMVAYFIKSIPPEYLKTISMSVSAVERADLYLLRQLQTHGVPFSETAKAVLDKKEHQPVKLSLKAGIFLHKFTDLMHSGITYNHSHFKIIKDKLSAAKNELQESESEKILAGKSF